jgi:predicted AlkP superfamily pyrophosphatase or phosphodiesterase
MTSAGRAGIALLALVGCLGRPAPSPARPAPRALVLVSLDGFGPDYLDRPPAIRLRDLAARGVRARWLRPVAPTLTFPNHYTIVTGLYPAHHGIVGNNMRDPAIERPFSLGDTLAVRDPRWWGGEPIWVTAERQGRRSAAFFWPGTEAPIRGTHPTWYRRYDPTVPNRARVEQVLAWLRLPADSAPALVLLYLGDVDHAGHAAGPDSPQVDSAVARVDTAIGRLEDGLAASGLAASVDLLVVSDHGMAPVAPDHLIYLDDFLDPATVEVTEWAPMLPIRPRDGDVERVYRALAGRHPHLAVYRRRDLPARFHYDSTPRTAPIVALADEGWLITTHARAKSATPPRGMHGYDPLLPSMRAIFLARGPSFPAGTVVPGFENVHLYPLLAELLGVRPAPADGRLDSLPPPLLPAGRPNAGAFTPPAPHSRRAAGPRGGRSAAPLPWSR